LCCAVGLYFSEWFLGDCLFSVASSNLAEAGA
jgi:hypothetical protein